MMRANIHLLILVSLAITLVSTSEMGSNKSHRMKRAPKLDKLTPGPTDLLPLLLPLMAEGQGQGPPLPKHQLMMNTPMNTGMMIEESFSGPLAFMGGLLILLSLGMAISYQAS